MKPRDVKYTLFYYLCMQIEMIIALFMAFKTFEIYPAGLLDFINQSYAEKSLLVINLFGLTICMPARQQYFNKSDLCKILISSSSYLYILSTLLSFNLYMISFTRTSFPSDDSNKTF